jgi:hypothetical protein
MRTLLVVSLLFCGVAFAQTKKLNYQQVQQLKDAKYYLDQSEGLIDAIDEKLNPMKVGDPSVQMRDVQTILNTTSQVSQYLTNTENRFKQLPADHPDVKPEIERHGKLKQRLTAQDTKANEIKKGLEGVVGQGQTAAWKADFDRLREINQMFGEPQILNTHPEKAIEIIKLISAVKAERARIAEKYAALLQQETGESRDMKGVLSYFDQQFGSFDKYCQQFAAEAPAGIRKDIADGIQMGESAVADKNPAYFGPDGGVNQRLSWAQTKLDILTAYAPDSAEAGACKNDLATARDKVKQMSASLQDNIIANNRVPEQTYSEPDLNAMIEMVGAKWGEANLPNAVLKTGINSRGWTRDTRWSWNSISKAWEKYDKSKLQGFVVVKRDDTHAVVHYVNFFKDHLSNDRITAYWFDDPKDEPSITHIMLLSNVK